MNTQQKQKFTREQLVEVGDWLRSNATAKDYKDRFGLDTTDEQLELAKEHLFDLLWCSVDYSDPECEFDGDNYEADEDDLADAGEQFVKFYCK